MYKPSFVNMDASESSVVDIRGDVSHLPFADETFDVIEADQLLEHFDAVHARIVLAEFHRTLRPDGRLVIETPDMEKAVKVFSAGKPSRQDAELQWIFGIDSPGLQHKTGFTKKSLKGTLERASFDGLRFEEQRTHKYEPGIRVTCKRTAGESALGSAVAKALNALTLKRAFDDSIVLVPLEEELARIQGIRGQDDAGLISRACVLNPAVALAIEDALQSNGASHPGRWRELLNTLEQAEFHHRAFTLWKKSSREGGGRSAFDAFTERLARDVRSSLVDERGDTHSLKYVLSLDPTPVRLLEYRLAMVQGQLAAGEGVRRYSRGMRGLAVESFREALAINPDDFCSAVNLARLMANGSGTTSKAKEAYGVALRSAPNDLRDFVARESSEHDSTGRSPDAPFRAS